MKTEQFYVTTHDPPTPFPLSTVYANPIRQPLTLLTSLGKLAKGILKILKSNIKIPNSVQLECQRKTLDCNRYFSSELLKAPPPFFLLLQLLFHLSTFISENKAKNNYNCHHYNEMTLNYHLLLYNFPVFGKVKM